MSARNFKGCMQKNAIVSRCTQDHVVIVTWLRQYAINEFIWSEWKDVCFGKLFRVAAMQIPRCYLSPNKFGAGRVWLEQLAQVLYHKVKIRSDFLWRQVNSIVGRIDVWSKEDLLSNIARHFACVFYVEDDVAVPTVSRKK